MFLRFLGLCPLRDGQFDRKARSLLWMVGCPYGSLMVLNYPIANGKAETGAFRFGGKEGLEDSGHVLR